LGILQRRWKDIFRRSKIQLLVFLLIGKICLASSLVVKDKRGKKIKVSVPVRRAVIVISYELIPALNIWDQVVGVSSWANDVCGIYRAFVHMRRDLKKEEVGAGISLNIEQILKLNPDLIITWDYNRESIRFLEEKGLKVIAIYPESIKELYDVIRMQGKIFGKEKRAERVIGEMEKIFGLIRKRVKGIRKRKKVIHLGGKPTRVSCGIGLTDEIIRLIGGINPAGVIKKRYADVSIERIIKWNPDVIFIWGAAGYDEKWIYGNSQFRFINAVKKRRVFKLPEWSTWSPRLSLIALYMAKKTYPDVFSDIDFEKVADRFYRSVFGISFFEVEKYERH